MKKEEILKKANETTIIRESIKHDLKMGISCILAKKETTDWKYDVKTKSYFYDFKAFEVNSGHWGIIKYSQIEFEFKGCTLVAMYNSYFNQMESKVIIPENNTDEEVKPLLKALKSRRRELMTAWKQKVTGVAMDYFNRNRDKFVNYPTVTPLRSESICIWTDGSKTDGEVCKDLATSLGYVNHHLVEWITEDDYSPVIWDSDDQKENSIILEDGVVVHFSRKSGTSEGYYPAIFLNFELVSSRDETFNACLKAQEQKKRADAYEHGEDFVRALNKKAEWTLNENSCPECFIPIIHDEDIDFIIKYAKIIYPDYTFEVVEQKVPLFDNELHKCIHVTIC